MGPAALHDQTARRSSTHRSKERKSEGSKALGGDRVNDEPTNLGRLAVGATNATSLPAVVDRATFTVEVVPRPYRYWRRSSSTPPAPSCARTWSRSILNSATHRPTPRDKFRCS